MQSSLEQHAGTAQLDRLTHLVIDRLEVEDVAFFRQLALQRAIESTKGAVFGTEIGVVDIPIDDVGDDAFRMELATYGVSLHSDADQIVGTIHFQRLRFGKGHRWIGYLQ